MIARQGETSPLLRQAILNPLQSRPQRALHHPAAPLAWKAQNPIRGFMLCGELNRPGGALCCAAVGFAIPLTFRTISGGHDSICLSAILFLGCWLRCALCPRCCATPPPILRRGTGDMGRTARALQGARLLCMAEAVPDRPWACPERRHRGRTAAMSSRSRSFV
jgi:hypothetical protein